MKKTVALILAVAMVFSLGFSVLALSVAPVTDQALVRAGEDVTVTICFDEAVKAVNTIAIRVYYDTTLFEKKSYEKIDANVSGLTSTPKTDDIGTYITLNYVCTAAGGADVAAGDFCRITFTAKKDITEEKTSSFSSRVQTLGFANATFGEKTEPASVSVTVKPAGSCLSAGNADAVTLSAGQQSESELSSFFTDSENHTLTYSLKNLKQDNNIKIIDGSLYFTSAEPGSFSVTVIAACAEGEQAELTFRYNVEPAVAGMELQYGYNETPADKVTVFATVSSDGIPLVGNDAQNTVLSHLEVEVPYFDLAKYGLEDYYRYATENGRGGYSGDTVIERPTAMHLFIYLLQRYYMGLPENKCGPNGGDGIVYNGSPTNPISADSGLGVNNMLGSPAYDDTCSALYYTGGATSTYMQQVWGHDENLMYYRNHVYPLMSDGWGSTSDYILLSDGDTIDMAMFTNWDFYHHGSFVTFVNRETGSENEESNERYLDVANRPGSAFTAKTGTPAVFSAVKFGTQSVAEGGMDAFQPVDQDEYAAKILTRVYNEAWQDVTDDKSVVASWNDDGEGHYTVTFAKAGTYYLLGMDDARGSEDACIAPGTAKIVVEAEEEQILLGDINGDGKVTTKDLLEMRKYLKKP
ncbi:MAG: cohesin domain-containing protein [Clostridia bacterium]|nr:cohesin domain-containing protein [Clostridia bacterium]